MVSLIDPIPMLQLTDNPEVAAVAADARSHLQPARDAVAGSCSSLHGVHRRGP